MYFETECVMAVHGHPRSLIMAPIESAYANSNLGRILPFQRYCSFSAENSIPPLFHPNFGGFPLD